MTQQIAFENVTHLHDQVSPKPIGSVIIVGPGIALRWLEKNTKNRNLRESLVAAYCRDMIEGRWQLTGAPIQFARDGRLLDGQHRLAAVIRSGVSLPFFVVRGLDADAQHVIDTGAKRTAGDALGLKGYPRSTYLAAFARLMLLIETGRIYSDTHSVIFTTEEVLDWVERHPEAGDLLARADHVRKKVDASPSAIAAAMWLTERVDFEKSQEFWHQLAERVNVPDGSPVLAIDSRLRELRRTHTNHTQRDAISMFVRGWNAWRRGKTMRSIPAVSRDGRIPDAL